MDKKNLDPEQKSQIRNTDRRYLNYLSDKIGVLVQAAGLGIKDYHSPTPTPSTSLR